MEITTIPVMKHAVYISKRESKGPPPYLRPKTLPVKMVRSSQEQHNEHHENLDSKNAKNCVFDASQVFRSVEWFEGLNEPSTCIELLTPKNLWTLLERGLDVFFARVWDVQTTSFEIP